jgi:hypothetical protein
VVRPCGPSAGCRCAAGWVGVGVVVGAGDLAAVVDVSQGGGGRAGGVDGGEPSPLPHIPVDAAAGVLVLADHLTALVDANRRGGERTGERDRGVAATIQQEPGRKAPRPGVGAQPDQPGGLPSHRDWRRGAGGGHGEGREDGRACDGAGGHGWWVRWMSCRSPLACASVPRCSRPGRLRFGRPARGVQPEVHKG